MTIPNAKYDVISGWRRPNGRLGIRNYVAILPTDDHSREACAAIAAAAAGSVVLPSPRDLSEGSSDPDLLARIAIGLGSNPNVAAAVLIGLRDAAWRPFADGIRGTGKPVAGFAIEASDDQTTIDRAVAATGEFLDWARSLPREQAPMSDLWISAKCEGSDATTGLAACPAIGEMYDRLIPIGIHGVFGETPELIAAAETVAARAADQATARKWEEAWRSRAVQIEADRRLGIVHPQPTAGNIAGGLTTAKAKALASLQKIGRTGRYIDVLRPAESPSWGAGLYFMDTSSETEAIAHMVAGGFVLNCLATGEATAVANPIVPILHINGNPDVVRRMTTQIDLDVAGLMGTTMTLQEAGDRLIEMIRRICTGNSVAAETSPTASTSAIL